jgi:hypothetical protein
VGLAWTIVGLIAGLSALAYVELAKRYRLDWKAWAGLLIGEFLVLFCEQEQEGDRQCLPFRLTCIHPYAVFPAAEPR